MSPVSLLKNIELNSRQTTEPWIYPSYVSVRNLLVFPAGEEILLNHVCLDLIEYQDENDLKTVCLNFPSKETPRSGVYPT